MKRCRSLIGMCLVILAVGCAEEAPSGAIVVEGGETAEGGETPVGGEGSESSLPGVPEGGESAPEGGEGGTVGCVDADNDGAFAQSTDCKDGTDCNDNDANVFPGAEEVCGDGIDQNCDFADESCCEDKDNDGVNAQTDLCPSGVDCDDNNANVYPGADEVCGDGIDQNCSGADEECPCETSCDGKACGDDGCGGVCGECAEGAVCTEDGICELPAAGTDSCVGNCGVYSEEADCQCDEGCVGYGDCCEDFCDECAADFPGACGCEDLDGDGYEKGRHVSDRTVTTRTKM